MPEQHAKPDWITPLIILLSILLAGLAGGAAFRWSRDFFATTNMIQVGSSLPDPANEPVIAAPSTSTPDPQSRVTLSPTPLLLPTGTPVPQWNGTRRVTVLIMGLDYRDWLQGIDIPRTDTMILLSIDPMTKTAAMMSIPRDMWVNIPGFGYSRINTAYRDGEMYKLPGGGMGLAMKTVEHFIGVPVDYCALIDFNSFVRFIDALGGLDMKIREPLKIDPIGPGNTRILQPGTQTLDGQAVLAYARNRYTKDGDFDRSRRQQEVIMALRKQIIDLHQLPQLVAKAPLLYSQLASGIRTNLTLDQVIQLAYLASQVDPQNIKQAVFDPHRDVQYGTVQTSDGVADILVPNPEQIRLLRDETFVNEPEYSPAATDMDLGELMKAEQARVLIKDGTGKANLGQQAVDLLSESGVQVTGMENLGKAWSGISLIDHSGKPYTLRFLIEKLNLTNARVSSKFDPNATVDIEVILGADWKGPQGK